MDRVQRKEGVKRDKSYADQRHHLLVLHSYYVHGEICIRVPIPRQLELARPDFGPVGMLQMM